VLAKAVPADQLREEKKESAVTSAVKRAIGLGPDSIKVRGADDMLVFRARCCSPIQGERIVGYITRGKGVSVHSVNCPNVTNLMFDPERRIEVEWAKGDGPAVYTQRLTLEADDRKGILADVSARIAAVNTNILDIEARTDPTGRATIKVTVQISDVKHLDKVMKSLRGVKGVLGVERARPSGKETPARGED
jgi:GTP pyrophosphokinase